MPKTYTIRHEMYVRVEAASRNDAARLAEDIVRSVRPVLPTGATLSHSRVIQRESQPVI